MNDKQARVQTHYDLYEDWELAEKLVDAEDEIEVWKAKVARLEAERG